MSDDIYRKQKPNLAKLPPHIRSQLSKPIEMRDGEVHGRVTIFHRGPALRHPTARVFVTTHRPEMALQMSSTTVFSQLDLNDFSGRIPLVTVLLDKEQTSSVLKGLMQSYLQQGGTIEDLKELISVAPQKAVRLVNPIYTEEESKND